jgi:hypothetical protein
VINLESHRTVNAIVIPNNYDIDATNAAFYSVEKFAEFYNDLFE